MQNSATVKTSTNDELDLLEFNEDDNVDDTYLLFSVNDEEYAIGVAWVTEIVRLGEIILVPDVASYILGVMNIRGQVVPLLDLRQRFGLPPAEHDSHTVVIVVEAQGVRTGLIVKHVTEVAQIQPSNIDNATGRRTVSATETMISGVARRPGSVATILDIVALLGDVDGDEAEVA